MPNIIINAIKLTGTYEDLETARAYLLQPLFGTRLGLACAKATQNPTAENPVADFKDAVFNAHWATLDIGEAVLSYTTAWTPSDVINAAVSKVAESYGVQPGDHLAITETILNETPNFWRNGHLSQFKEADSRILMKTGFLDISPTFQKAVNDGLTRLERTSGHRAA